MSQLKSALASFRKIVAKYEEDDATAGDIEDLKNIHWLDDQIKNMTPGALDVAIERSRQITEKGYDQTHDDKQKLQELTFKALEQLGVSDFDGRPNIDCNREDLKIAAALLIAEYDRLGRIEAGGE